MHFLGDSDCLCSPSRVSAVSLVEQSDAGKENTNRGMEAPLVRGLTIADASGQALIVLSPPGHGGPCPPAGAAGVPAWASGQACCSCPSLLHQKFFLLPHHWPRHHHLPGGNLKTRYLAGSAAQIRLPLGSSLANMEIVSAEIGRQQKQQVGWMRQACMSCSLPGAHGENVHRLLNVRRWLNPGFSPGTCSGLNTPRGC